MYKFTEDCLTGIEQIDKEHEKLFELINRTMQLLNNKLMEDKYHQVREVMEELKRYADTHFANEEAYMAAINDPELELQKKQHAAFREKINVMDFSNIDELTNQHEMLEELLQYLVRWLYQHILSSDILIGKMPSLEEWKENGNPCAFTEKYMTGIPLIDGEHETLFEIIGDADKLVKAELLHDKYDEIVGILEKLKNYTSEHFQDEEEFMESIQYSGIGAQKMAHQAFISKLEEIDLDQVDQNQQEYLEELVEFLFGWLSNHILKSDKLIAESLYIDIERNA
ncbi:bacteriohemerythrin [Petralouisia muris]|uniref:Bacteriohemerythrin n=1 Tax=Petralouisia muris TaxID=3032872 RepID=A0AC61RUU3_9FIRM|nr:hemerythrin family protein [Petralouisia muris]TGY95505.1 bacteriohemerythrin [Petralouisia muris]